MTDPAKLATYLREVNEYGYGTHVQLWRLTPPLEDPRLAAPAEYVLSYGQDRAEEPAHKFWGDEDFQIAEIPRYVTIIYAATGDGLARTYDPLGGVAALDHHAALHEIGYQPDTDVVVVPEAAVTTGIIELPPPPTPPLTGGDPTA
jgi:hypothetical protein